MPEAVVMKTKAFQEVLFDFIQTEDVCVKKDNGVIQLVPVEDDIDCTIGLRGMFAGCPELSSYRHSEEKQLEKELEL